MTSVELAQVWVPLMPEASRLAQGVNKIAGDAEKRFGKAGSVMGASLSKGVDMSARKAVDTLKLIEKHTVSVEKANKANADAIGRVEVAHRKLAQVTANAKSTDLQRTSAAEAYKRAQRAQELQANALTRATKQLTDAEKAHASAQRQLSRGTGPVMSFKPSVLTEAEQFGTDSGNRFSAGFRRALGAGAALAVGGGFVAGVKKVIDAGLSYESALNTLQGVTRASGSEMAAASQRARELGMDTQLAGVSAQDAAVAMAELAKGGFTLDEAMRGVRGTLQLATAAQINAGEAAKIQASTMKAFQLDPGQAENVADMLANVANASVGDIPDFAYGLQMAGSVAHGFGLSVQDTVAALGMFANAGIKGSDAGTLMKTSMQAITDQGNPAQGAIEELGLQLYDAQGKFVGYSSMLTQVAEASGRMSEQQFQAATNVLFGSDAMRASMIAANGGAEAFREMWAAVGRPGGAAEMARAQMQGLPGVVENIKNTAEGAKLAVYDLLRPSAISTGTGLKDLLDDVTAGLTSIKDGTATGAWLQISEGWRDISGAAKDLAPAASAAVKALATGAGATLVVGWRALGAALQVLEPPLELIANILSNPVVSTGLVATLGLLYAKSKLLPPVLRGVESTTSGLSRVMSELRGPLRNVVDESTGLVTQTGLLSRANEGTLGPLGQMRVAYLEGAKQASEFGRTQKLNTDFARGLREQMVSQLGPWGRFKTTVADSTTRLQSMSTVMGTLRSTQTGVSIAAGGLMSALGGPWGVAIMGATTAIGLLGAAHANAAQKAAEQRQREKELQETLDVTTGKVTEATRAKVKDQLQSDDKYGTSDFERASDYGIDKGLLIDAATGTGDKNAYEILRKAAVERGIMPGLQSINEVGAGGAQINWESIQSDLSRAGVTTEQLQNALLRQGNAWEDVSKKIAALPENQAAAASGQGFFGLQQMIDAMDSSNESVITLVQNLNGLRNTFDDGAAKAREGTEALNGQWAASDALKQKYHELGAEIVAVPTKTELTVQVDPARYAEVKAKLQEAGNTVNDLPGVKGGPAVMKVEANTDLAKSDLANLLTQIRGAKPEMDVAVKFKTPDGQVIDPAQFRTPGRMPAFPGDTTVPKGGRARGGRVDPTGRIWGPGSGTSDSILARILGTDGAIAVSNGESINTERSTRANWPVIDAMNKGADLSRWFHSLPGYKNGGVLGDAGGLLPFTRQLRDLTLDTWPQISEIGGYRSPDGYNEHSSGRALDVMIPNWDSPRGRALGDQIAQWALSIPGVDRVMWQQSIIRPGGQVEPIPDRGSATANHMDHVHIFTDQMPSGSVPSASMPMGGGYGLSSGGGYGGGGGTPAQQRQLRDASQKVQDKADAVEEAQRDLDTTNADPKATAEKKEKAEKRLAKAEREHQDALDDLAAKQEEVNASGAYDPQGSGGPDGKSFGQQMLSGALEALGFDGEIFSDPTQWGIFKTGTGVANWLGGIAKNWNWSALPGQNPNRRQHGLGGSPGPGNYGDGGLGMNFADPGSPIGDTFSSLLPQVSDFLPNSQTGGMPGNNGNYTTHESGSHNTSNTGAVFNGPITVNQQPGQPQRGNTYSLTVPGAGR